MRNAYFRRLIEYFVYIILWEAMSIRHNSFKLHDDFSNIYGDLHLCAMLMDNTYSIEPVIDLLITVLIGTVISYGSVTWV